MAIFRAVLMLSSVLVYAAMAQPYISYLKGDSSDVATQALPGLVLAGGAGDNNDAMKWMLQRADSGDVVVLRVSDSDGYNNYFYTSLKVPVNSVETLVIPSADAAAHPYVEQRIRQAEVLFIAGGDQAEYVTYWKDSPVEAAINYLMQEKKVTVGGTSAGCAILGHAYFSALNGTVGSQQALNSPYSGLMTIGYNDFLLHPWMQHVITDTHYDNPDRRGRHIAFLARLTTDYGFRACGIGIDEYTAVCIDESGIARVFGEYPTYDDYAYFLQANCFEPFEPETCQAGQKITWIRNQQAVKVYRVPGNKSGQYYFDLNDWESGSGGKWQDWYVDHGQLFVIENANPADCYVGINKGPATDQSLFPNPASDYVRIRLPWQMVEPVAFCLMDAFGKVVFEGSSLTQSGNREILHISLPSLVPACYFLQIATPAGWMSQRLLIVHP
ncbi:MAG: Type 1 glutamine amidotransferase-like domain-containing protein [Chitinophagales bacterium]|nr:Type 1 glutamine amidotransferase-like domain-containing protein [Chitinophagales bacterium]MDW8426931.1 Type 1 glutamine amidotransferase-like domain-containing protein [Chitinophagales bacterium]